MLSYTLGIDTSNYTTSIAILDEKKNILIDNRKLLYVKEGKKGLRQSDAFFQHVINIPELFRMIDDPFLRHHIKIISVSSKPRPIEGSYMPVFRAAQSFGKTLAHILGCEYREFSHQENHIEAAKWSLNKELNDEFISVHISGGTTEILHVKDKQNLGYDIKIIGGTSDISAGQFIDRIGVRLGYKFPAGKTMDEIALKTQQSDLKIATAVKDTYFSFSGPETMAHKLIDRNENVDFIVKAVIHCVAQSLEKAIIYCLKKTKLNQVLFIGGVASSDYIRRYFTEKAKTNDFEFYFGHSRYCTDNAVGTALLAIKGK